MSVDTLLATALSSVIASIELSEDSEIDPDVATAVLEPVAALFSDIPEAERLEIVELFTAAAEAEEHPVRREFMRTIPEGLGLV